MLKNKRLWLKWFLALAGALTGLAYWKFVGCSNGVCPIQSLWYFMTLWGLAVGYLVGDILGSFLWRRAAENE